MATKKEIATDTRWEKMKYLAVEHQQCFYELLPDCIIYQFDEHKYLKQNIGYAIYGSPISNEDANATENSGCYCKPEDPNDTDADIADTVDYDEKAKNIINMIYNKICEYAIGTDYSQPIYFGIIYNIIFRPKIKVKSKEKYATKKVRTEVKEKKEEVKEGKEEVKDEKELSMVCPIPIFKIRKSVQKKSSAVQNAKQNEEVLTELETDYETWYIDINGRVYKNWKDYIESNNLPKCTMILPKDGFYQADVSCPHTEDYSTVWLEIIESPACAWKSKLYNGMDIFSSAVGISAVGLGVISLFTPIAPFVAASGLAVTGMTGVWTIGRCSQQLIDRSSHEESIHLLNKEAFAYWLGIAGSAVGLGAVGGSAAISTAAARGMTVPMYARMAFNTVQGSNIILNGIGIVYNGCCMVDKYRTDKTVSYGDVLNLVTHIMFFAGSVVKVQFADDIIKSTQGKVINDYKESLRSKNLRKKFNRTARQAAENNTCKISENAEVIRYIRNRQQLLSVDQPSSRVFDRTTRNIVWSFEQGKLRVNGIILLDPIEFARRLVRLGILIEADQAGLSGPQTCATSSPANDLIKVLYNLLSKLYLSDNCPKNMPTVPDFEPLLREMSYMNINEDYLKMLFTIAERLIRRSKDMEDFLLMAFTFVWQYCKANLKQWGINSFYRMQSDSGSNILRKIVVAIFEAIDMVLNNLHNAFAIYVEAKLRS